MPSCGQTCDSIKQWCNYMLVWVQKKINIIHTFPHTLPIIVGTPSRHSKNAGPYNKGCPARGACSSIRERRVATVRDQVGTRQQRVWGTMTPSHPWCGVEAAHTHIGDNTMPTPTPPHLLQQTGEEGGWLRARPHVHPPIVEVLSSQQTPVTPPEWTWESPRKSSFTDLCCFQYHR